MYRYIYILYIYYIYIYIYTCIYIHKRDATQIKSFSGPHISNFGP